MKRKEFIKKSVITPGIAATFPFAMITKSESPFDSKPKTRRNGQVPGIYRTKVGHATITAILDGFIDIDPEFWVNLTSEQLKKELALNFMDPNIPVRISVNTYIIDTGERAVALDTGAANFFGPSAGRYAQNLKFAGYAPDSIDVVLLTHMHSDHIGGLIAGGKAVFPNAEIIGNAIEHNYWANSMNKSNAPEFAKPWFDAVQTVTKKYDGRITLYKGEKEVIPGFQSISHYGHTPGHSGYIFLSNGEKLFFWADITDQTALQLNHPERTLIFDVDKEEGQKARQKGIELAVWEKMQIARSHVPFPSFGYIDKTKTGYHSQPSPWKHEI
ncbi:MAG: MBL fold metallo-hydrolase [Bacteroidota bacterium]